MTVGVLLEAVGVGAWHVLRWTSDMTVVPGPAPVAKAQDPTLSNPTWVCLHSEQWIRGAIPVSANHRNSHCWALEACEPRPSELPVVLG